MVTKMCPQGQNSQRQPILWIEEGNNNPMKENEEFTGLPIEQLVKNGDSLNDEQKQVLVAFQAEMETQDSWKTEVFKEIFAEDPRSTEGIKRREENQRQLKEMLIKHPMKV
jgi:hypothetical protein